MVMTHTHTQTQVQRSVDSKDRVETNGRTNGQMDEETLSIALPSRLTRLESP